MVRFTAHRSKAQVVAPARQTPRETKALSEMDDCAYLNYYICAALFFRQARRHGPAAVDPAKAIRAALAEALVHYYPLAGRLRELPGGRLVVDCTAEGVVFVEADADVRLQDFGQPPLPPYPCVEELLCLQRPGTPISEKKEISCDIDGYTPVLGNPLVYMQVTRLRCGSFVICVHMCHNVVDGFGMIQFMRAIADLARGEARPTVMPVWKRENIFKPRTPGCARQDIFPGCASSGIVTPHTLPRPPPNMVTKHFWFGPKDIAALRSYVPEHLVRSCTMFELLSAFLWRCRTIAGPWLPAWATCVPRVSHECSGVSTHQSRSDTTATAFSDRWWRPRSMICAVSLGYALELVQRAKLSTTEEHVRSSVDMITALRTHRHLDVDRAFHISDTSRLGDEKTDMGWAKMTGGGVPYMKDPMSYHMASRNKDGEVITSVSSFLTIPEMERLAKEISTWIRGDAKKKKSY